MSGTHSAKDAAALFDGSRLTLARHLAGLRKTELAKVLDVTATAVAGWEANRTHPTPANVANLSMRLGVEPGFFAARQVDSAASTTVPHFRSLRSTTQIMRDQAHAYGHIAIEVAAALEVHAELPHIDIPRFPVAPDDAPERADEAARILRQAWALDERPVPHLVRLAENHGILVVFSAPATASLDAYSFDSTVRPVVVLNPIKRDYYRQRFDLAHELGHLVMHADADPGSKVIEDQAHRFAAEFLMPATQLGNILPTALNRAAWVRLGQLKEEWRVSMASLLYRARTLETLSQTSYRNAMITMTQRGWRRAEPGLIGNIEQPSLLPASLSLLAEAGIDVDKVRSQCRVPPRLFDSVTARVPTPVAQAHPSNGVSQPGQPSPHRNEPGTPGSTNVTSLLSS